MATYRISGTAQTSASLGDVTRLDDAVGDEPDVTVEQALRTDDGGERERADHGTRITERPLDGVASDRMCESAG